MKKMNKKGFTLAELLIVLAILAILIAIAIPVFTAQLENARRQADHANLRSAYAIVQTANILGLKDAGLEDAVGKTYSTDGTFGGTTPVKIQSTKHVSTDTSCQACVVDCTKFKLTAAGDTQYIFFVKHTTDGKEDGYALNTSADTVAESTTP